MTDQSFVTGTVKGVDITLGTREANGYMCARCSTIVKSIEELLDCNREHVEGRPAIIIDISDRWYPR